MDTQLTLQEVLPEEFDAVYDVLERNFVLQERRERKQARIFLQQRRYTLYHICDADLRVGFISLWELDGFTFAEHFVIYECSRNRGYGSRALQAVCRMCGTVVLEAEHPDKGMRGRRIAFYQRNGFCINDYPYLQPPYREGGEAVSLLLLSYPHPLRDVARSVEKIYQTVYGRTGLDKSAK